MSAELLQVMGSIRERLLTEVFAEASNFEFDGSFRLSFQEKRKIVYFRKGKVVFAVSNERNHRIFAILLEQGKIKKEQLAEFPNFVNDFEFAQALLSKNILKKTELDEIFRFQTEKIVRNALGWQEGEWVFNALARAKEEINYEINLKKLLIESAREVSTERLREAFPSLQERFSLKTVMPENVNLLPAEAFVLSRFDTSTLSLEELFIICALPGAELLRIVYTLWLAGFLERDAYRPIFSQQQVEVIKAARLQPKREEKLAKESVANAKFESEAVKTKSTTMQEAPKVEEEEDEEKALQDYLSRVENAKDFYEVLGVSLQSTSEQIKKAYFSLAKRFHPDKFHKEAGTELHKRIQKAFSDISRAYETLKDEKSRRAYDLKREKAKSETQTNELTAKQAFDAGYELMMKEEYEKAYPLLARAVFLEPENAHYRAFYGKLLSFDSKHKYKAEKELQQAVKLDPQNPTYRLMLADFYVRYGLVRRAEGELRRLLEISPNNAEALQMLKNLSQNKR